MSIVNVSTETFINKLKLISESIVWKDRSTAIKYESKSDPQTVDLYMAACDGLIVWQNIRWFPKNFLRIQYPEASDVTIDKYYENKLNIPQDDWDTISSNYAEYLISSYEGNDDNYNEQNNYYRRLYGLPNLEDEDSFWIIYKDNQSVDASGSRIDYNTKIINESMKTLTSKIIYEDKDVFILKLTKEFLNSTVTITNPFNEMFVLSGTVQECFNTFNSYGELVHNDLIKWVSIIDNTNISRLEFEIGGYFDIIYDSLPTAAEKLEKKYLKHMYHKRIRPFIARKKDAFGLLYYDSTIDDYISRDFEQAYQACRTYITQVHYSDAFKSTNEYYDGLIGMSILLMTIHHMYTKYIEADTTRDFYDVYSLQYVYDSYGVPFYPDIPLSYHKQIVKRINYLIAYKGSYQIITDLCNIFSFDDAVVNQYFLVKDRNYDIESGSPVPLDIHDGMTPEEKMAAYRRAFRIGFIKVPYEKDPYPYLKNQPNFIDYYTFTKDDPLWINDYNLLNLIYSTPFNYKETKYLGIDIVYDMMKIVNETCYFIQYIFKLKQDGHLNKQPEPGKTEPQPIVIQYDQIDGEVELFDMLLYLIEVVCRQQGYHATINTDTAGIAKLKGYNYKEDLAALLYKFTAKKKVEGSNPDLSYEYYPNGDSPSYRPGFDNVIESFYNFIYTYKYKAKEEEIYEKDTVIIDSIGNINFDYEPEANNIQGKTIYEDTINAIDKSDEQSILKKVKQKIDKLNSVEVFDDESDIGYIASGDELFKLYQLINKIDPNEDEGIIQYINIGIKNAKNREEYYLYRRLKDVLLTTSASREIFKSDSGYFETVMDYLTYKANVYHNSSMLKLLERLTTLEQQKAIGDNYAYIHEMEYALDAIEDYLGSLLPNFDMILNMNNSRILSYLNNLIAYFKSAKVTFKGFHVVFSVGGFEENYMKLFMEYAGAKRKKVIPSNGEPLLLRDVTNSRISVRGGFSKMLFTDYIEKVPLTQIIEYNYHDYGNGTGIILGLRSWSNIPADDIVVPIPAVYKGLKIIQVGDGNAPLWANAVLGSRVSKIKRFTFVPDENGKFYIKNIAKNAFTGLPRNSATSMDGTIAIPEGVTTIRETAFASSTSIKKFILPSTLTSIEKYAFAGFQGKIDLTLPYDVIIDEQAFPGTWCTTGEWTLGLDQILYGTFAGFNIPVLNLPNVVFIGEQAFAGSTDDSARQSAISNNWTSELPYYFITITINIGSKISNINPNAFRGRGTLNQPLVINIACREDEHQFAADAPWGANPEYTTINWLG